MEKKLKKGNAYSHLIYCAENTLKQVRLKSLCNSILFKWGSGNVNKDEKFFIS